MNRGRKIAKGVGLGLLTSLILVVVLGGALFFWLRGEPSVATECDAGERLYENRDGIDCIPLESGTLFSVSPTASQFYLAIGYPSALRIDVYDNMVAGDIPGLPERMDALNNGVPKMEFAASSITPNLEILVQVEPDLIVSGMNSGELNRAMEAVAPVVLLDYFASWKENMLEAGELVGERDEAAAMLAEYEARVQILQEQFDDPSAITISHVRVFNERTDLQLSDSFAGQIIRDVGFSFPEPQQAIQEESGEQIRLVVSEERMDLLDGDFVFLYPGYNDSNLEEAGTSSQAVLDALQSNPLFQTLNAAESGTVAEVDVYWTVTGIYSAHYILDDLFRHVAGVDPEEVSPNPVRLK